MATPTTPTPPPTATSSSARLRLSPSTTATTTPGPTGTPGPTATPATGPTLMAPTATGGGIERRTDARWTAKDFDLDQDQKQHREEPLSEETLHKTKPTDNIVVGPKKKS